MNRFLAFTRALLFLAAALPIAAATLALLIAGWTATAVLSVTPLVVPVLLAFRWAIGSLAAADAAVARSLLGVDVRARRTTTGGRGYWRRGSAVLADGGFWRQQVYLALRMTFGFALAVGELSLLAGSLGAIVYPAWYRWSDLRFGSWHVDTLSRSFVLVPAGLAGLVVAVVLARLFATGFGSLARWLLGSSDVIATPLPRATRRRALAIHAAVSAGIGLLLVLIWALTGGGYVWPEWALLPLALLLAIHGWSEVVEEQPRLRAARGVAVHAGIATALFVFLVLVWTLTTRGYFWPMWPALGLGLALLIHSVAAYAMRGSRLARRVGVLEETRAGAVDAQETELRRIERDLHDGAQARLVALGMSLGLAEQKFASDPGSAQQLVAEARVGVGEALRELRDLARGIHPPVLADRGVAAALQSLADRSAIPVSVEVTLPEQRLPDAIESAAYFVAAEALANAAKHSGASRIDIDVRCAEGRLKVAVFDDGAGGADATGAGLAGLRRRVEALDGTLRVSSPAGGPTTVDAELPCES